MREIKFRAWDKKERRMVEDKDISRDTDGKWCIWDLDDNSQDKNFTLMQYTGLKDKNGKKIYEGDIVERVYGFSKGKRQLKTIDEIVYKEEWGAFAFYSKHKIGEGWSRMYDGHKVYPYEIIGNIYESEHLLDNTDTKV